MPGHPSIAPSERLFHQKQVHVSVFQTKRDIRHGKILFWSKTKNPPELTPCPSSVPSNTVLSKDVLTVIHSLLVPSAATAIVDWIDDTVLPHYSKPIFRGDRSMYCVRIERPNEPIKDARELVLWFEIPRAGPDLEMLKLRLTIRQ